MQPATSLRSSWSWERPGALWCTCAPGPPRSARCGWCAARSCMSPRCAGTSRAALPPGLAGDCPNVSMQHLRCRHLRARHPALRRKGAIAPWPRLLTPLGRLALTPGVERGPGRQLRTRCASRAPARSRGAKAATGHESQGLRGLRASDAAWARTAAGARAGGTPGVTRAAVAGQRLSRLALGTAWGLCSRRKRSQGGAVTRRAGDMATTAAADVVIPAAAAGGAAAAPAALGRIFAGPPACTWGAAGHRSQRAGIRARSCGTDSGR